MTKELYIGKSLDPLFSKAEKIAQTDSPVFITGESGSGKEILATYIQNKSLRNNKPYITINCAAMPAELMEIELFGYTKGSFTDATEDRVGKFEACNGGTLLLDEIGEIPLSLQAKLLRVLETGIITRIGSNKQINTDVRIISATNTDIQSAVKEGYFRKDLFFRLNVFHFHLPPLKERKEDIPALINHFISGSNKPELTLSAEALSLLLNHNWPGNIRELKNCIQRAVILCKDNNLLANDFDLRYKNRDDNRSSEFSYRSALRDFKTTLIREVLRQNSGNRTKAAKELGIQRTYLSRLISELEIHE